MFDLFRSRQKAVRYLLGGILGVIALTMVITLIPGIGTPSAKSDDPTLAEIGGHKLTAQEVMIVAANKQIPPEMLGMYLPQLVDNMVQQRALVYEFQQMGFTASDDEVYNMMARAYPQFFENGVLKDKRVFEGWLNQNGQTIDDAINLTREQVISLKVEDMVFSSVVVGPKEVDDAIGLKFDNAKIKYVSFPGDKFKSQVSVTPEEIKASFDAHRNEYTLPEKRSFTAVVLDQDKVAASIEVTDAQLHAAYSANQDNFRMPERTHVRHILVMTQGKPDADKPKALAKAQDLLKQLRGGADFAQVAEKNSDDTSNASKGGDLGWIVHGQMVEPFEKAAFALQPKQISDVVTTQFGYHIIQCLEKDTARLKPFDEVKATLADDLRKQGVADKMQSMGDQLQAALAKAPGSAQDIAKQFGATPITVTDAEANAPIPTLGVSPEIEGALGQLKPNGVSPVLLLPANRLAVVVLNNRIPTRLAELSEVESKVKDKLLSQKADGIATQKAIEAAGKIRGGEDMAKVAKSMGLTMTESIEFTRSDSVEGLGGAAQIQDAFTKPVGSVIGPINQPATFGMVAGMPVNVVYQIVDQRHVNPANLSNERAMILGQLKQDKARKALMMLTDSVYQRLAADKKVTVNKDAVKRLTATLH
jgi:peptidyl-prolyl cis-trans isomerase D